MKVKITEGRTSQEQLHPLQQKSDFLNSEIESRSIEKEKLKKHVDANSKSLLEKKSWMETQVGNFRELGFSENSINEISISTISQNVGRAECKSRRKLNLVRNRSQNLSLTEEELIESVREEAGEGESSGGRFSQTTAPSLLKQMIQNAQKELTSDKSQRFSFAPEVIEEEEDQNELPSIQEEDDHGVLERKNSVEEVERRSLCGV